MIEDRDDAGTMVSGLLRLLEGKAREPAVVERLRAMKRCRLQVLVFERDAGLRAVDVTAPSGAKATVRLPDQATVAGQRVYAYDITLGFGGFKAAPMTIEQIQDGVPLLFTSAPVLAAIFAGEVQTPNGPIKYDAARSFQNGDSDFIGADPGEFIELLSVFEDLVNSTRAELGIGPPTLASRGPGVQTGRSAAPAEGPELEATASAHPSRARSTSLPEDQPW